MLISVIMSVFNTNELWLRKAIESILDQTVKDYEFIIVLDCPTDNSNAVVYEYANRDRRIRILENIENLGLTKSLNRGLEAAQGKYIARMDADDISLPTRFEKQVDYLERHEGVAAVGCRCSTTSSSVPVLNDWTKDRDLLRARMLFRNTGLPHPTAMIRHSALTDNHVKYTEWVKKSQDYKLWVDLLPYGDLVLLPDILFIYREHDAQVSANGASLSFAHQISVEQAERLMEKLSEKEKAFHCTSAEMELPENDARGLSKYYDKLLAANKEKKIYDQDKLKTEIDYLWCQKAFRRLKLLKKADMAFSLRTLRLLTPRLLRYTKENKRQKNEYVSAVEEFKNHQQTAYLD